jgi:hypothetical protein
MTASPSQTTSDDAADPSASETTQQNLRDPRTGRSTPPS